MKSVLQEEKGNCVTSASCTMTGEYSVNAAMFPTVPKSAPLPHTSMLTIYMATPKLVFWCHYSTLCQNMQQHFRTSVRSPSSKIINLLSTIFLECILYLVYVPIILAFFHLLNGHYLSIKKALKFSISELQDSSIYTFLGQFLSVFIVYPHHFHQKIFEFLQNPLYTYALMQIYTTGDYKLTL